MGNFQKGTRVLCGGVRMWNFRCGGEWEARQFTGRQGIVVRPLEGVSPASCLVEVEGKIHMIENAELVEVENGSLGMG